MINPIIGLPQIHKKDVEGNAVCTSQLNHRLKDAQVVLSPVARPKASLPKSPCGSRISKETCLETLAEQAAHRW